jgi:HSP20 family protein
LFCNKAIEFNYKLKILEDIKMNLVRFNKPAYMNALGTKPFFGFSDLIDDFYRTESNCSKHNACVPPANIIESENDFRIELSAPGFQKSEFKITLDKNLLTVSREVEEKDSAKETKEEENKFYSRIEYNYSEFSRSFNLPKTLDSENISANYENGILSISIPKNAEEVKLSRDIEIS